MTVGDPKKAIVLAVIAVAIVSIAVFRMMPSAPAKGSVAAPVAKATPAAEEEKPAEAAATPAIDAFSHPNLAVKNDRTKDAQKQPQGRAKRMEVHPDEGSRPFAPETVLGGARTMPGVEPDEKTGKNQQLGVDDLVEVRVDAIVRGGSSIALLRVAEGEPIQVNEGFVVDGFIKILQIKDSSVVISASGKRREIRVGQAVKV